MNLPLPTRWVCPECGAKYEAAGRCSSDGASLAKTDDELLGYPIGSYRIVSLINAAGMGRVYKAVQPSIGARVAVKVLSAELAGKADLVERFFAEARAVNIIRHEQIINIIDLALLPDGRPYIVMEYLDGATLADTMRYYGQCPAGTFGQMIVEILGALQAAHTRGIVHRDLKPSNVFVSPQGRPKVLDFGIAKLDPNLGGNLTSTNPGQVMGTPAYMAPEQALGRTVDARADVYAMGVILYEGVAGKVPFDGETIYSVLHQVLQQEPTPIAEHRPGLPPAYEQVILRALSKEPAQRFATAREMAAALSAALAQLPPEAFTPMLPPDAALAAASLPSGRPTPATPPRLSDRRSQPVPQRGRRLALVGGLAAGAAAIIALALAIQTSKPAPVAIAVPDAPPPASAPVVTPLAPPPPPPTLAASRTSDGFLLNFRFPAAPDDVELKLPDDSEFRSRGDRTWVTVPPSTPRGQIMVKYRRDKEVFGPYALTFDPDAVVLAEAREALSAFPRWIDVRGSGKKRQLGFGFLQGYRAAITRIAYGFDEEVPSKVYLDEAKVPPSAKLAVVQVTFVDATTSEIRKFDLAKNGEPLVAPAPPAATSLVTGIDECDAIFTAMTDCYRKTLAPDEFGLAARSLAQSAGTIRDSLGQGTPRDELVRRCQDLRETYRQASKGRGCEL